MAQHDAHDETTSDPSGPTGHHPDDPEIPDDVEGERLVGDEDGDGTLEPLDAPVEVPAVDLLDQRREVPLPDEDELT